MHAQQSQAAAHPIALPAPSHENDDHASLGLVDLLGLVEVQSHARGAPISVTAAPAAEPTPPTFNDVFASYLAYESGVQAILKQHCVLEKQLFGRTFTETPRTEGIERIAAHAIDNLIRHAQEKFKSLGGTLEINSQEVLEAVGCERWTRDCSDRIHRKNEEVQVPVDLDKIWAYLEKTFEATAP